MQCCFGGAKHSPTRLPEGRIPHGSRPPTSSGIFCGLDGRVPSTPKHLGP